MLNYCYEQKSCRSARNLINSNSIESYLNFAMRSYKFLLTYISVFNLNHFIYICQIFSCALQCIEKH